LVALLHGTLVVGVSQTLRRWTEGATYIRQGDHHVGHWPTFLVFLIMAALSSRCGHYTFILWFLLLLSFFLSFPRHTWCGLSAKLQCRSWTCCMRLAAKTGLKNRQKIAIWAPSHNFVRLYLRNKARVDNRKRDLLNSNISSTWPHKMVNFGPLMAEICWRVWGTPANFNI